MKTGRTVPKIKKTKLSKETGKAVDFKGVFDGKGHTIYNLRNTTSNYSTAGMER